MHKDRYVCIHRMIRKLPDRELERHVRTAHNQKMLGLHVAEMEKRQLIHKPTIRKGVLRTFLVRLDDWVQIKPEPI